MSQDLTRPEQHPAHAAMDQLVAGLDLLAAANLWSASDDQLCRFLDRVAAVEARLAAEKLSAVTEAEARNIGVGEATDTAGWLRGRQRMGPREARETVRLARSLRSDCAATGAALAAAQVSAEQARVIVGVLGDLPPVDALTRTAAEEFLIGQAAVLDPVGLRKVGRRLSETLTTAPDVDGRLARQQARRSLHLVPAYDGMVLLRGLLDTESAATLTAALDPLAAPRPAGPDGAPDPRTPGRRRADALTDLARGALASGRLPEQGGAKPTLVVTIDHDTLTGRITGAGLLPDGEPLPASAARRIGCDAKIIPVVLGGPGQPLDIGRAARIVPEPMRRALVVRDQACAFPGCDRLPSWAEAHHIIPWAEGGDTALNNLVLLCLPHHKTVHDHGWTVALDSNGLPYFRPPSWIDPDRQSRQHHRYTLRRLPALAGPAPPRE
jgi:hypothetical protein